MTETSPDDPVYDKATDLRLQALHLAVTLWKDRHPAHGQSPSLAVLFASNRFYQFLAGGDALSNTEQDQLNKIERIVVSTQDDVNAITTELQGVTTTLQAEIANLEQQVAAGGTIDLTGLKAAADALNALATPATGTTTDTPSA